MIRNYPISLRVDHERGEYMLMLGEHPVAMITPDEPLTGPDALRALLGIAAQS